ncbi:MFS transporter [Humisphaera borealis]|uniref:MFS transporter n=1 Tax=Humisphaera borealis TaxID=2807512 RepID=A0A7M2WU13_9BACT|nr:MFS transporter [Humisphaera borealis]QOV88943.1 MFS transporter [Humisphaera borealis]
MSSSISPASVDPAGGTAAPNVDAPTVQASPSTVQREATRLSELSPQQWKSGIAAWLGWLFDGLDMHLYTLVAAPFVAVLLHSASPSSADVKEKSAFIQAAFLVGWALGGGFFGRLGDLLGRSRALSLTILTYALFTGLSFFATEWWHLLICRFLAALGIGGEWAVGSALLSETWPARWRAWIAAVLQTGVNLGVLLACGCVFVLANPATYEFLAGFFKDLPPNFYLRSVFLVGIVPALLVFWIRRHVPEPAEWTAAQARVSDERKPTMMDLFRGDVRRTTLLTIGVCATALTGWWAFMFWSLQHLGGLAKQAGMPDGARDQFTAVAFLWVIGISILGNFFASGIARKIGYRNAVAVMCFLFIVTLVATYYKPRGHEELRMWMPIVGFCSGVMGLFTMYLPPLFPTLLRTTGAGFSYNIGRIVAAAGTVIFAFVVKDLDLRLALLGVSALFVPAMLIALKMPDLRDK